jgi:hypothetical protein
MAHMHGRKAEVAFHEPSTSGRSHDSHGRDARATISPHWFMVPMRSIKVIGAVAPPRPHWPAPRRSNRLFSEGAEHCARGAQTPHDKQKEALPAYCRQSTQHSRPVAGTTYADLLVLAGSPMPASRSERKNRLHMPQPTSDPSQEGNRPGASACRLSSREGLRLGSCSTCRFEAAFSLVAAEVRRPCCFRFLGFLDFAFGFESEPPHVGCYCVSKDTKK